MLEKFKSREAEPRLNDTPKPTVVKSNKLSVKEAFKPDESTDTLSKLLKQQAALEQKIKQESAKAKTQARRDETRRKVLVGAYVLKKHEEAGTLDVLKNELDKYLSKNPERRLFGLRDRVPKKE